MKKYILFMMAVTLCFSLACSAAGSAESSPVSSLQESTASSQALSSGQTTQSGYQKSSLADSDIYQGNDIKLTIKSPVKMQINTKNMTLTFENLSDNQYGYGKYFSLEIYRNNEWEVVPMLPNHAFETVLIILKPHAKQDIDVPVAEYYSNLVPGKYRIIQEVVVSDNVNKKMSVVFDMN